MWNGTLFHVYFMETVLPATGRHLNTNGFVRKQLIWSIELHKQWIYFLITVYIFKLYVADFVQEEDPIWKIRCGKMCA